MLGRFATNIRAGLSLVTRLTAGRVALGAIVVASLVTPRGWRLFITIAAVGLLIAAVGAYLGIDLDAENKEEDADALADLP